MDLTGFALLITVLVVIPGPAVTLVMKQSLMRGRTAALSTALGVFSADLVWVLASVVGLTAVIVASQPLLLAIRYLGAAYLCWLGLALLLRRSQQPIDRPETSERRLKQSPFTEGAMCDLSNPKTLLVFTSVIPQFLPADGGTPLQAVILGVTFGTLGLVSLTVYAVVLTRLGGHAVRSKIADVMLRIAGAVLVAFGVQLAVEPAR